MTHRTDNLPAPSESLCTDAWAYPEHTEGLCPYGCGERVFSACGEWHHKDSRIVDAECQKEEASLPLVEQIAKVQAMARHLGREGRLPGSQALIDAVLALSAEGA